MFLPVIGAENAKVARASVMRQEDFIMIMGVRWRREDFDDVKISAVIFPSLYTEHRNTSMRS
jgi:hypothetical protein